MNIGTIAAILGAVASFIAILAALSQGIRDNGARLQAEKGRVIALFKMIEIQGKRIEALEDYAALPKEEGKSFHLNSPLIDLEIEARNEYKKHHTDLT